MLLRILLNLIWLHKFSSLNSIIDKAVNSLIVVARISPFCHSNLLSRIMLQDYKIRQ